MCVLYSMSPPQKKTLFVLEPLRHSRLLATCACKVIMKVYTNMTSDDTWMTSDDSKNTFKKLFRNAKSIIDTHQVSSPYE